MKRILAFLLAFMVLAFSVLPCADGADLAKSKTGISQSSPQENDDADHNDTCSPFCICSCCAGYSVVTKISATPALLLSFQPSYNSYVPERLHRIALPVWQPPRLA